MAPLSGGPAPLQGLSGEAEGNRVLLREAPVDGQILDQCVGVEHEVLGADELGDDDTKFLGGRGFAPGKSQLNVFEQRSAGAAVYGGPSVSAKNMSRLHLWRAQGGLIQAKRGTVRLCLVLSRFLRCRQYLIMRASLFSR